MRLKAKEVIYLPARLHEIMKELNMVQINDEGKHGKGTQLITLHYHD
jgi:hypothetical protein